MAVKTVFSKEDFRDILEEYELGELVEFRPIGTGTVQTNYLIQTTDKKVIFRYYENRTKESVLFELSLLEFLYKHNYPCPKVYQSSGGLQMFKQKPYAIFEYMQGEHSEHPNATQKEELVRYIALLNKLTTGYVNEYKNFRLNYTPEQCKKLAIEISEGIGTTNAKLKLKWYLEQIDKLQLPSTLPMGVCHCDFNYTNVLYKDNSFSALIDFDDANYTYVVYDLVALIQLFKSEFEWDTWHQFTKDENVFCFVEAREIVYMYNYYRPLTQMEKYHLFDVYKLSILIDCLWYFERGNVNDFYEKRKIEYLDEMGREKFFEQLFR